MGNNDGGLTPGERFNKIEHRLSSIEDTMVALRIEGARQQVKLAIIVGMSNFLAFSIVELAVLWFKR